MCGYTIWPCGHICQPFFLYLGNLAFDHFGELKIKRRLHHNELALFSMSRKYTGPFESRQDKVLVDFGVCKEKKTERSRAKICLRSFSRAREHRLYPCSCRCTREKRKREMPSERRLQDAQRPTICTFHSLLYMYI